jgi:hypothetical protein
VILVSRGLYRQARFAQQPCGSPVTPDDFRFEHFFIESQAETGSSAIDQRSEYFYCAFQARRY